MLESADARKQTQKCIESTDERLQNLHQSKQHHAVELGYDDDKLDQQHVLRSAKLPAQWGNIWNRPTQP